MPVRVFNLRGVPDDEAEELREFLEERSVDFYETPAGRWGMSSPGLWIRDDARHDEVRQLIAGFQEQRTARMREEYAALKAEGRAPSFLAGVARHPIRFVAALLAVAFIVYVSVGPFLRMIAR